MLIPNANKKVIGFRIFMYYRNTEFTKRLKK